MKIVSCFPIKRMLFVIYIIMMVIGVFGVLGWSDFTKSSHAGASVIYVDQNATGVNDGSSWINAFTDFQDAINASTYGSEIWIAQGVYTPTVLVNNPYPGPAMQNGLKNAEVSSSSENTPRDATFLLKNGVNVFGGFPTGGGNGTFGARDVSAFVTILSGDIGLPNDNQDNSYHVVVASTLDETTILDGFTITDGYADSPWKSQGGGMFIYKGEPTLQNIVFEKNYASYTGGGLYVFDFSYLAFSPKLNNVTFRDNSSQSGGGLYNRNQTVTIINSTIVGNQATIDGGGITNFGALTLKNSTVSNNLACINTNNCWGGGGIHGDDLTIENSTISGNIVDCSAPGNTLCNGGGIFSIFDLLSVNSSTIVSNTVIRAITDTNSYGGGIFVRAYSTSALSLVNTIVANNDSNFDCYNEGAVHSDNNNIIGVHSNCGTPVSTIDPGLAPLADNGGSTMTHALLPGSPAIDMVSSGMYCGAAPTDFDQRGMPRPQGAGCDIGAFECALIPVSTAIALNGLDVVLTWQNMGSVTYQLWRSDTPYFYPGAAGSSLLTTTSNTTYTDIGITSSEYYYQVLLEDSCSTQLETALQTGILHFPITPGS